VNLIVHRVIFQLSRVDMPTTHRDSTQSWEVDISTLFLETAASSGEDAETQYPVDIQLLAVGNATVHLTPGHQFWVVLEIKLQDADLRLLVVAKTPPPDTYLSPVEGEATPHRGITLWSQEDTLISERDIPA
jgi:hypothetical protein